MQYQVPQFIEVEDKIFGPLTLKQFIYIAGAGGLCLLFFTILPIYIAIVLSLPFAALGLALAFYKINDRPLIITLEHGFSYMLGTKLYIWKQRDNKTPKVEAQVSAQPGNVIVPSLSQSKLKDLAWALNIKDRQKMGVLSSKTDLESNMYGNRS